MSTEVWAGMASLQERGASRTKAIDSLLPQVDRLTVTLGDGLGDQVKFASCEQAAGFFFSADDDLIYPPDYVARTLEALERHPGTIVGYHGWSVDRRGEVCANYRCLDTVEGEHTVHVLGSVCLAFHVDTIRPTAADFPMMMADVWLAAKAARSGVSLIALPHEAGWFGYMPPPRTIWDETRMRTGSFMDASRATRLGITELVKLHYGQPT